MLAFMQFAQALFLDSSSIYWSQDGVVWKAPLAGGPSTKLAVGGSLLAIDSMAAYWINDSDPNGTAPPALWRAPLSGGLSTVLVSLQGQSFPRSLVLDANNAYWTSPPLLPPLSVPFDAGAILARDQTPGSVMKAPLTGGGPTELAGGQVELGAIAVDATSVYWTTHKVVNFQTPRIYEDGSLLRMPLAGGAPTTLATGQANIGAIAVDAANVYWANTGKAENDYADGAISKLPLSGGTPVTLASAQSWPAALAVDATNLYWANAGADAYGGTGGALMRMPLAGGPPEVIASGSIVAVAVDETSVYWASSSDGSIMRATPK
jgi:hypothetical protein